MGALNILRRYLERNSSGLPADNNKLRQHIVAVASEAKLPLPPELLDELAPMPKKQKGAKSGDSEAATEKSGDTPDEEI